MRTLRSARLSSVILSVCAACASNRPAVGELGSESAGAVGSFHASEHVGTLASSIAGTYRIDSLHVHVMIDSAAFWLRDTSTTTFLGGMATALGYERDDSWSMMRSTPFTLVERTIAGPDTVVLRDVSFAVSRAGIRRMQGHWLVFVLARGGLRGQADVEALGYGYAQSARDLFTGVKVRVAHRAPVPDEAQFEMPDLVARSCGQLPAGSPRFDGQVAVFFVVDTLGRVEAGSVEAHDPQHARLEPMAESYLATCEFTPGRVDGRRVRSKMATELQF